MTAGPGLTSRLWLQWKNLKLPWRKQRLIGADLAGNTFWVFKDAIRSNRYRRIVKYSRKTHYADIKISPQWHQWLRHTRDDPPSINEQQLDEIRQVRMKQLAAAADERWASQPSFLDPPREQSSPGLEIKDPGGYKGQSESEAKEGVRNAVGGPEEVKEVSGGRSGEEVDQGRFKGESRERRDNVGREASKGKAGEEQGAESSVPKPARRT